MRESANGFLAAWIAVEEKLSAVEEELKLLREQLFESQDSLTNCMEVERLAEEARERAK